MSNHFHLTQAASRNGLVTHLPKKAASYPMSNGGILNGHHVSSSSSSRSMNGGGGSPSSGSGGGGGASAFPSSYSNHSRSSSTGSVVLMGSTFSMPDDINSVSSIGGGSSSSNKRKRKLVTNHLQVHLPGGAFGLRAPMLAKNWVHKSGNKVKVDYGNYVAILLDNHRLPHSIHEMLIRSTGERDWIDDG